MRLPYFQVRQLGKPIFIYWLVNKQAAIPFTVLVFNVPAKDFGTLNKTYFTILLLEKNVMKTQVKKPDCQAHLYWS